MFDPRDFTPDPRGSVTRPRRDHGVDREQRQRDGHRREYDPRTEHQTFEGRVNRALADVGMYRSVAYRDLAEAHFEGHPYAARRAVDRMVRAGHVREHTARGPQGGTWKVLTLTGRGVERAEGIAREQGLDPEQKAWSGLVKPNELQHDVAVFRAARIEQVRLLEQGAVLKRIRIDAELKREIARATETARARGGKEAADAARFEAAESWGFPSRMAGSSTRTRSWNTTTLRAAPGASMSRLRQSTTASRVSVRKPPLASPCMEATGGRRHGWRGRSARTTAVEAEVADADETRARSNFRREIPCNRGGSVSD